MEGSDDEGALSPDSKRFNGPFSDIRHLVPGTGDFQEFVSNLRTTPGVDLGLLDRSRQGGVQEEEDEFDMGDLGDNKDAEIEKLMAMIAKIEEANGKLKDELGDAKKVAYKVHRDLKKTGAEKTALEAKIEEQDEIYDGITHNLERSETDKNQLETQCAHLRETRDKLKVKYDAAIEHRQQGQESLMNWGPCDDPDTVKNVKKFRTDVRTFETDVMQYAPDTPRTPRQKSNLKKKLGSSCSMPELTSPNRQLSRSHNSPSKSRRAVPSGSSGAMLFKQSQGASPAKMPSVTKAPRISVSIKRYKPSSLAASKGGGARRDL